MLQPGTFAAKSLAVALLALVCALALFGIARPVAGQYGLAISEVRQLRVQLSRIQKVAARAADLQRQVASTQSQAAVFGLVGAPASDGAAAAALQRRIEQILDAAGARVSSVQVMPARDFGTLRRIGLRIQFSADTASLRQVIHALEFGRPVALVENLFIHARSDRGVGAPRPLTVRLDVSQFQPGSA